MTVSNAEVRRTQEFIWEKSRVPLRFQQIEFSDLTAVTPSVVQYAETYCEEFAQNTTKQKNGLYLFSPTPGTGKTALAAIILKTLIRVGAIKRMVSFFTMSDIIDVCRQTMPEQIPLEHHSTGYRLFESEALVIDDVGKGRLTEWAASEYFRVINKLYNDMKPCIFTSNLPPSQLITTLNQSQRFEDPDKTFGQSVVSRMVEMVKVVKLEGKDYRNACNRRD